MPLVIPLVVSLLSLLLGTDEAELVFAGDAMQHAAQIQAAHRPDGKYDYSGCFDSIAAFVRTADYAVVNLETPLGTGNYTGYPCFNAPESWAQALIDAGFDLLLTANNHTLDRRDQGLRHTVAALDRMRVSHIGTYAADSVRRRTLPFVQNINNIRVAFLNYTYGTNGFTPGPDVRVDYIDRELIKADIAEAHDAGAEIICVCMHWGVEYVLLPVAEQKALAEFLKEQGVDLIIGAHPHVIQPMELEENPATGRNTLLVYSLGNLISNMRTRDTRGGAMVRVLLQRGADGVARVEQATYLPVFTVPADEHNNFRVMPADAVTDPHWVPARDGFLREARRIFDSHNRSVHIYNP